MPEKDPETLFYGSLRDRKVAAEDPDEPADSFRVRVEQWADHIPVYDRENSTKGYTNPKSNHHQSRPGSNSSSQRFSTNLRATTRLHHSRHTGRSARRQAKRRPAMARQPRGQPEFEPTSPKVSCFGKVLPEAHPDRCRMPRRESEEDSVHSDELVGCWGRFMAVFRPKNRARHAAEDSSTLPWNIPASAEDIPAAEEAGWEVEAAEPGLGGMKRFASGRRAASWGEGWEVEEDGHVGWSERERVWARRSVGSLEDAERHDSGWESEGSASV